MKIAGVTVPEGFCVTTEVFKHVIARIPEFHPLLERLSALNATDSERVREIAETLRAAKILRRAGFARPFPLHKEETQFQSNPAPRELTHKSVRAAWGCSPRCYEGRCRQPSPRGHNTPACDHRAKHIIDVFSAWKIEAQTYSGIIIASPRQHYEDVAFLPSKDFGIADGTTKKSIGIMTVNQLLRESVATVLSRRWKNDGAMSRYAAIPVNPKDPGCEEYLRREQPVTIVVMDDMLAATNRELWERTTPTLKKLFVDIRCKILLSIRQNSHGAQEWEKQFDCYPILSGEDGIGLDEFSKLLAFYEGCGDLPCGIGQKLLEVMHGKEAREAEEASQTGVALTGREQEILGCIAQHLGNKQMARKFGISEYTVKNHLHNIYDKLGADNRYMALDIARQRQWVKT